MRTTFLSLSCLLLAAPAAAGPLEILPSGHPVVQVSIDGSAPHRFVIDTAASATTILPGLRAAMPNLAAQKSAIPLNGASGSVDVETARVERLTVDGHDFGSVEMLLLPPSPVDNLGVDGILGADIIADFVVEMDMPGRHWRMLSKSDPQMLGGLLAPVPFTLDAQRAPRLTIRLNGVEVPAILDTGARGTIINWAAARAIGLSADAPDMVRGNDVRGASNHATASFKTRLESLAVGQMQVAAPEVRIADLPVFQVVGFQPGQPAVILGIDMFADRRFVIDHLAGRLHVSPPISGPAARAAS